MKALAQLDANPDVLRGMYVDTESGAHNVIVTTAIRLIVAFEMQIPKAKYDALKLLVLLERVGQTTH